MLGLNHNQNRIIALVQPKPDFESTRKHVSSNVIEVLKVELTHRDDVIGSRTAPMCTDHREGWSWIRRRLTCYLTRQPERVDWLSWACKHTDKSGYTEPILLILIPQPTTRGWLTGFILTFCVLQLNAHSMSAMKWEVPSAKSFYRWVAAHVWLRMGWLTEREQKSSKKESYCSH